MAIKGVDVSNHQGSIDWQKVKNSGIDFAIIRAGYGRTNIDFRFKNNIEGAIRAGLPVGVYWFSYALSGANALEEAKTCVNAIQNYKIILPVFYDFEAASVDYAKRQGVSIDKKDYNNFTRRFCDYVESRGYRGGVYYNLDFKRNWVDMGVVGQYVQWLAYYTTGEQRSYDLQQYSNNGKVSGINGSVDLDWLFNEELLKNEQPEESQRVRFIKELQRALNGSYDMRLDVDGSAGPLTRRAIEEHYLYYRMPTIKNAHVGWLQKALKTLGYEIDLDNSYGPATRQAVQDFQKKEGLEVDGFAGLATHMKILDLLDAAA